MDGTWTMEQVLALAPDPAAARAARGLAEARRWDRLGEQGAAVWGECRGSGSRPYEVAVDLGGPAYRCSCPSRKHPCKHALGLLLRWTLGGVPEEAPPGAVTSWLTGRRERAARGSDRGGDRGSASNGGQAREQTAARRGARIAGGLVELDRWLRDLIRQGLGAAQAQPYAFWDSMAARLVDAQAPGIASRLRRMAGIAAGGGAGWPGRLLEEAALLHLAASAWSRLDRLPDGLRADLRTIVGWPHRGEDVLAGPTTRDRWAVLATQTDHADRLMERRTWLWGLTTGRPALLLDFAPVRGGFTTAAPRLGTAVDAELAFYPGAAPLRALVATVHGDARPLRRDDLDRALRAAGHRAAERRARAGGDADGAGAVGPSGSNGVGGDRVGGGTAGGDGDVRAALTRHAAAVARNPWLDRFPMSLGRVRPEWDPAGLVLRDAAGAVLPTSAPDLQGWVLMAVAGGRPIGLVGEWRADALRPLSAIADGRVVPLQPTACGWPAAHDGTSWHRLASGDTTATTHGGDTDTVWGALLADALLGTARRAPGAAAATGRFGEALARIGEAGRTDPEAALLDAAATVAVWRRAGRRPAGAGSATNGAGPGAAGPGAAGPERLPRCGAAAGRRLARLLTPHGGRDHSMLLPEWLTLAAARGMRAPEELLPALLEHGASHDALQPGIWRVLGERGRWLAGQRDEWGWAAVPRAAEAGWRAAAHPGARRLALQRIRADDPARARELLAEAWERTRGAEAADLLGVLGDRLGPADEPFLEAALGHAAAKVRLVAAELLPRLPGSRLAHRMTGRVRALFRGEEGWDGAAARPRGPLGIARVPPPDPAAVRDGIQEQPGGDGRDELDRPGWWLYQLAAAAPLGAWTATTGHTPAELVRLADLERDGNGEAVLLGWAVAVVREGDPAWAAALLEALDPADHPGLLGALPGERAEALVLRALGTAAWGTHDRAWRLLRHYPTPWPERVQRTILDLLVMAANGRDPERARLLWQYLGGFATRLDPVLAAESGAVLAPATTAPVWGRSVETFLEQLAFRRDLHAELAHGEPV